MPFGRRRVVAAGASSQSGTGWGSGNVPTVRYANLPLASTSQLPDYNAIVTARSANTTTPWTDPYSGLNVYRMTTDAEGLSRLGYGNGGPWVSLPDSNGTYWIASSGPFVSAQSRLHMFGFRPSVGRVAGPIDTGLSGNVNGDVALGWSHVDATVFYRMNGRVLRKYTWNGTALSEVVSGVWPKDLSAFGTSARYTWMTHDTQDRVFACVSGSDDRVIIWDSVADTVTTLNTADVSSLIPSGYVLDEAYISHDARYVMVKLSPLGFTIYDRTTGHTALCIGHTSHPSIGREKAWMVYGYSVTNTLAVPLSSGGSIVESRFEWVAQAVASFGADVRSTFRRTTAQSIFGASAKVAFGVTHSSISHAQTGAVNDQWWIQSGAFGGGDLITWDTAWALHSGAIYSRTWAASSRTPNAVVVGTDVVNTVDSQLTAAASLGAMTAGTFFADSGTRTLYVWHPTGAAVSTTNVLPVPTGVVKQGVYAVNPTGDGTEDVHRAVAFSGNHPRQGTYDYNAFASTSPDGRVCAFNSDFGRISGPQAICVVALPTAS